MISDLLRLLDCSSTSCRRIVYVCMLMMTLIGLSTQAAAQPQAANGVVKILASETGDDPQREGSGFVVAFEPGLTFIATAAHVVEGDPRPRVIFAAAPHQIYEATPVQLASDSDVAVLKVVGFVPGTIVLPFDERPVEPADPLQAIGFPRRTLQPRWSTMAASSNEGGKIVLDEELAEGHSGGPLLRGGWVVGMVNTTEQRYSFALPTAFLCDILSSWKIPLKKKRTQKYVVPYEPPPAQSSPVLSTLPISQTPPRESGCVGVIKSLTGANQPVRIAAVTNATILRYLPVDTRVVVVERFPNSAPKWYRVSFENMEGWIEGDQLELGQGCVR